MKVPIIIDGNMVKIHHGAKIIEAAQKAGIYIPTLCYHDNLNPYGSCRLCMVEVVQNKQRRMVTACSYPVERGMEVFTDTPKLRKIRSMIIELLLSRCPEVPVIRNMARKMGIDSSRFKRKEENDCILCGLCVRFCEEVVGVGAIGLANRGIDRQIATPFQAASDVCIGCGSCTYICPTGCIEMAPDENIPRLRTLKMGERCWEPCPNSYECESCPTDQEFLANMKSVITEFRHQ